MKLTKENIEEWKKELDEKMVEYTGKIIPYSKSCPDQEWFDLYEDEDTDEAVKDFVNNPE